MKFTFGLIVVGILATRLILYTYNYPDLNSLDPSLEYLVISHIFDYHEFPWVGTTAFNGLATINSPLYYYVLALFLFIHHSIFTLNILTILLQSVMALAIVGIVRRMVDTSTAFISLLLISLSMWGMHASRFFFQPHLSQPLFFVSLYLLLRAYEKKSLRFIYTSIVLYILATSFYLSSIMYLPLYLFALVFVLRRIKTPSQSVARATAVLIGGFTLSFGSVIASSIIHHTLPVSQISTLFIFSFSEYILRLQQFFSLYLYLLIPENGIWIKNVSLGQLTLLSLVGLSVLFFFSKHPKTYKQYATLLLVCIGIPFLIMPACNVGVSEHYLHLALGFTFLYIALLLRLLFFRSGVGKIVGTIVLALFLYITSDGFRWNTPHYYPQAQQALERLVKEADLLQTQQPNDFSFLRLLVGRQGQDFYYGINYDYLFWHLLEEKTHTNRTPTLPHLGFPSTPYHATYLFLTCTGPTPELMQEAQRNCVPIFTKLEPYELDHAISSDPPFVMYRMRRVETEEAFVRLGDNRFYYQYFPEAAEAYKKALEINPANIQAINGIGNSLIKQNNLDEAAVLLQQTLSDKHADAGTRVALGRIFYLRGDYTRAEALFQEAIQLYPTETEAYFDLGKLYRILRRYEESEATFSQALRMNSKDYGMMFGLGYLYMQYREFDKAEKVLLQAMHGDPTNDSFYSALADTYVRMHRFEEAERMFQKALDINPHSDVYIGLGEVYFLTGRYDLAEKTLKQGMEVNPKPDRYQGLGNFYVRRERFAEAITMFQKAIDINPYGNAYIGLGNVYMMQKKYKEAEEIYKKTLNTPYKAQGWLALGNLYTLEGDYEVAETLLTQAITDQEIQPDAFVALGNLYLAEGNAEKAKTAYQRAIELDAAHEEAQQQLKRLQ